MKHMKGSSWANSNLAEQGHGKPPYTRKNMDSLLRELRIYGQQSWLATKAIPKSAEKAVPLEKKDFFPSEKCKHFMQIFKEFISFYLIVWQWEGRQGTEERERACERQQRSRAGLKPGSLRLHGTCRNHSCAVSIEIFVFGTNSQLCFSKICCNIINYL